MPGIRFLDAIDGKKSNCIDARLIVKSVGQRILLGGEPVVIRRLPCLSPKRGNVTNEEFVGGEP